MNGRHLMITAVACTPVSRLRRWLYGRIPAYEIAHTARIGWLTMMDVDSVSLGPGSRIGRRCHIGGPMRFALGSNAALGDSNRIECGDWFADVDPPDAPYAREFVLGDDAHVTTDHFFDALGGVYVGEGTWIAGRGSQFWTHGLAVKNRSVTIGHHCYIGSAARFAPGARVGDLTTVGLGSVVVGDLSGSDRALVAGVPAVVARAEHNPIGWKP